MSDGSSNSEVVAAFQAHLLAAFLVYSMASLVVYEYIITIQSEVRMVWQRKWTLTTWIFIANRYAMIAMMAMEVSPYTAQTCRDTFLLNELLVLAQQIIFIMTTGLRLFAICGHRIPAALVIAILGLVSIGVNIWFYTHESADFVIEPIIGAGCAYVLNLSPTASFDGSIASAAAGILASVLVLVFTWRKTFRHWMNATKLGISTPLTTLLLRDGTLFFAAGLAMNVAMVLVQNVPVLQKFNPVSLVIPILNPILISRFLLNLRDIGETTSDPASTQGSRFYPPAFHHSASSNIIGNIGEDLVFNHDAEEYASEFSPDEASLDTASERGSIRSICIKDSYGICEECHVI